MSDITLPYKNDFFTIECSQEEILYAPKVAGVDNMAAAFRHALKHPFEGSSLQEIVKDKKNIVIVINDITRHIYSAEFLPVIVDEIQAAGGKLDAITVLIATGAHRPATSEEIKALVGDLADRIRVVNHSAFDSQFVKLGQTSFGTEVSINKIAAQADCLILTGGITFHYLAGFSGGRKSVLPGVAAFKSISANHSLVLKTQQDLSAVLKGNPVAEDMEEAAGLINPSFCLNVVLNAEGELVKVFSGDWKKAHVAGCEFVRQNFGISAAAKKLIVASAGGFPKDINFYQAFKGLYTAMQLVEEGGEVVFFAACPEAVGEGEFLRFADINVDAQWKLEVLHKEFSIARYAGYLTSLWAKKARIYVVSDMPENTLVKMGLIPISFEEALKKVSQGKEKWVIPHAGSISVV